MKAEVLVGANVRAFSLALLRVTSCSCIYREKVRGATFDRRGLLRLLIGVDVFAVPAISSERSNPLIHIGSPVFAKVLTYAPIEAACPFVQHEGKV